MDGNLPAAAVVGEVMGEAEGFFAEGLGKLLLLFNLLLVKDAPKFVQSVVRITIEGRDILCGILTNINRSPCYSRTGRAVRIALGRHGETRGEAYGVIDLVLLLSAHLVIVAVVVVLGTYALRVVVCLVFQVTERERPGREAVLLFIRLACNDGALEAGVFLDVDVEAAFSGEDAGLASRTSIVGEPDS